MEINLPNIKKSSNNISRVASSAFNTSSKKKDKNNLEEIKKKEIEDKIKELKNIQNKQIDDDNTENKVSPFLKLLNKINENKEYKVDVVETPKDEDHNLPMDKVGELILLQQGYKTQRKP